MRLNVQKQGNSLSVILPQKMATDMNISDRDILFAMKTPSGYEIGSPGMGLVVREPISQNPYWMGFSELTPNHNCIMGYSPRSDPQSAE